MRGGPLVGELLLTVRQQRRLVEVVQFRIDRRPEHAVAEDAAEEVLLGARRRDQRRHGVGDLIEYRHGVGPLGG